MALDISENAIGHAKSVYKLVCEQIERTIQSSDSFEEAQGKLQKELTLPEFIKSLGKLLFESMTNADVLGRSYVVSKDRHFSKLQKITSAKFSFGKYIIAADGINWFSAADKRVEISFNLIPQEALDYLHDKGLWIAGVENQDLLNEIQIELERALRDGTDYKEFAKNVRQSIEALGIEGQDPIRLNTVFRTNLFSSYTIGQLEQVQQVKDRFPMWRYMAILDSRTRPTHRALNGKIFPQGEGPIPPIDYNCRCSMQMLHEFEIQRENLKPISDKESNALLKDVKVRFDQKADFEKWLVQKQAVMDARIKNTILSEIK
jgi:SPP1 gp7 family putative phage head morphogenesis protein